MSDTFSTLNDEKANTNKGLSVVKVRDVEYNLDINDYLWKASPLKFAQTLAWSKDGTDRATPKRVLPGPHTTK